MTRLLTFLRRHLEVSAIVPALLVLLAAAWAITWYRGLPALEVGPILTDYLVGLLPVALLGYLAWRFKAEYWYDLSEQDEKDLHERAANGNRNALWLIVKDRLEWLALFGVLYFAFTSFAGAANPATQCTRDLLVRWEVSSAQAYARRWQWPIWPGGASGITWGVGYDGGHQAAPVILREWAVHAAAPRLATTAGIIGKPARAALPAYRDIVVPWAMAVDVLEAYSIPRYRAAARRAYGRYFDAAPWGVQCALTSETYNRGEAMAGSRRAERREIRDRCLPAGDAECTARQLEASCRVWANDERNGPGLCARRRDEARVARAGHEH
jgi:hypothetical protein